MNKQILDTEISKAVEHLARLLRNASDKELYCHMTIFTRDKGAGFESMGDEIPDYFDYRLSDLTPEGDHINETIVNKSGAIYYADVDGEAYIKKVMPYKEFKNE